MRTKPPSADPSNFSQLVEVAKDAGQMREVFQRHLRPLGEGAYQVRECQLYRIRCRQARRCILEYTLRLEEPGTGRERRQWVTGVMFARGQTRRIWEDLRRSDPGRENPAASPIFAPFSYIPELEMLVEVFPYDRRLPSLSLLMAGLPPELEPLLLPHFGPGDWQAEAWDVEPVRYLAETRATLLLRIRARDAATGRVEERRFYAKVYRKEEKGERTYQVLRELWDKASAGGMGFTVGRPVAYLSGPRLLIQEEVPGTSLKDVLLREEDPTPVMCRAARTLAALHLDHVPTSRRRFLREEVADLEETGKLLRGACPHLEPEIEEIVGTIVAGLEEVPPAPTHCDLGLGHILLDGDRLALIDLDAFAGADPVLDVAQILSQLSAMSLLSRLPHDRARTAARAFAGEYFAHVPAAWHTRFTFHYASAVLKRAAGLSKRETPGWPEKIETLLEEAKDSAEGRVW